MASQNVNRRRLKLRLIANTHAKIIADHEFENSLQLIKEAAKRERKKHLIQYKIRSKKAWKKFKKNPESKVYWKYENRIKNSNYKQVMKKASDKYQKNKKAKRILNLPVLFCSWCGKKYKPKVVRKIVGDFHYCSRKCKDKFYGIIKRNKRLDMRVKW